jgi:uncharacterized protein YuzE
MEIDYDKGADALYIRFRKGRFARNKRVDSDTIFDFDGSGNLLGIELLDASKRIPDTSLSAIRVKNIAVR